MNSGYFYFGILLDTFYFGILCIFGYFGIVLDTHAPSGVLLQAAFIARLSFSEVKL